jgi:hypothetical protein
LAQRAYRQRKETTISGLKKRVADLETIIEEMNQAYLGFNDAAISSGILTAKPELGQQLRKTTETFVRLAKEAARSAANDDDEGMDELEEDVPTTSTAVAIRHDSAHQSSENRPPVESAEQQLDIGWGYSQMWQPQASTQKSTHDIVTSYLSSLPSVETQRQPALPFGLVADPIDSPRVQSPVHQFNVTIPSPPAEYFPPLTKQATLKSPYTYSFQETTIARRIQRAAIERAYHLLSTSHQRPQVYQRVFRLALLSSTRDQLIARFQSLLSKQNLDSFEYWQSPYIHLGGAGTHYPKRDANGNVIRIPNSWSIRGYGPFNKRVQLLSEKGILRELEIDLRGYEGEWFDPNDVQGYLEEKGLVSNPNSSFAEAWVDIPAIDMDNSGSPLAMDLGLGFGSDFTSDQVHTVSGSGRVTPSLSSRSNSTDSANTPPTPMLQDFGLDMTANVGSISGFDFDNFGFGDSDMSADLSSTSNKSTPTLQHANTDTTGFFDPFSFDNGGLFNGNDNDFTADLETNNKKANGNKPGKRLVTVDLSKLIESKYLTSAKIIQ